jgi:hypothetical protein
MRVVTAGTNCAGMLPGESFDSARLRLLSGLSYSGKNSRCLAWLFMSGRLRQIALTVEQGGLNSYTWVLIESADGRVFVLKKAPRPQVTYMDALSAGYEELALLSACGLHESPVGTTQADRLPQIEPAEFHDAL